MTEKRNILLLGRTGSGKSTLGNVLINKNDNFDEVFAESDGSISETRDLQIELLEINMDDEGKEKINYRIVDTVGVGDTKLTPQGVLYKLGKIAHELRDGLNQVLFVTRGRFTKEEAEAYDLLGSIIFDSEVVKYTTIIRTGFSGFLNEQKCEEDRKKLKKENPAFAHIFNSVRKIIYVDNPTLDYGEMAIQIRKKSRERLIAYLGGCQETYRPSNLDTLNERIGDYMTNEEKLIKEMQKLEKIRKEQEEKFLKEIEELRKQQAEDLKKIGEQNKKDIEDAREKGKEELQKTVSDMENKQQREADRLRQENKEQIKNLQDSHRQESQRIINDNRRQLDSIQEQNRRDREANEKLIGELREKSNSSADKISSALTQLSLSSKSSDDNGKWAVKMKELENNENNSKRLHEKQMQELKNQQKENQTKAVNQTQTHVEERNPRVVASLAGAGAAAGSVFGPAGTVVGAVVGGLLGKLFS